MNPINIDNSSSFIPSSKSEEVDHISSLPEEMICEIFACMPVEDQVRLSCASNTFQAVVLSDRKMQRRFTIACIKKIGIQPNEDNDENLLLREIAREEAINGDFALAKESVFLCEWVCARFVMLRSVFLSALSQGNLEEGKAIYQEIKKTLMDHELYNGHDGWEDLCRDIVATIKVDPSMIDEIRDSCLNYIGDKPFVQAFWWTQFALNLNEKLAIPLLKQAEEWASRDHINNSSYESISRAYLQMDLFDDAVRIAELCEEEEKIKVWLEIVAQKRDPSLVTRLCSLIREHELFLFFKWEDIYKRIILLIQLNKELFRNLGLTVLNHLDLNQFPEYRKIQIVLYKAQIQHALEDIEGLKLTYQQSKQILLDLESYINPHMPKEVSDLIISLFLYLDKEEKLIVLGFAEKEPSLYLSIVQSLLQNGESQEAWWITLKSNYWFCFYQMAIYFNHINPQMRDKALQKVLECSREQPKGLKEYFAFKICVMGDHSAFEELINSSDKAMKNSALREIAIRKTKSNHYATALRAFQKITESGEKWLCYCDMRDAEKNKDQPNLEFFKQILQEILPFGRDEKDNILIDCLYLNDRETVLKFYEILSQDQT